LRDECEQIESGEGEFWF